MALFLEVILSLSLSHSLQLQYKSFYFIFQDMGQLHRKGKWDIAFVSEFTARPRPHTHIHSLHAWHQADLSTLAPLLPVALLKVLFTPCGNICLKVHICAPEILISVHSSPDNYSSLICALNEA